MIARTVKVQLVVFFTIALTVTAYAVWRFTSLREAVNPPIEVVAHFTSGGGIYPRAEVDLLGDPVGSVTDVTLDPSGTVAVSMSLQHGTQVPRDVLATITNRSAVGEQYVQLTPRRAGPPYLAGGAQIPVSRTRTPLPVPQLLGDLNSLADSLPLGALRDDLRESAKAFDGTASSLRSLLDDTDAVTDTALRNLQDTINLIDTGGTVLSTQLDRAADIATVASRLAQFTRTTRGLAPTIARAFVDGTAAGQQLDTLLADTAPALPALLNHLNTVNTVLADRTQNLRKFLVLFPYVVENGLTGVRYCDKNDLKTGKPIQSTCHYNPQTGLPQWSAQLAVVLPINEGSPVANPCTKGYGGTIQYLPNGSRVDDSASKEPADQRANLGASCTASPTDPQTPNVRGSQNAQRVGPSATGSATLTNTQPKRTAGVAVYDPSSGNLLTSSGQAFRIQGTTGAPPLTGGQSLSWLLSSPLAPPLQPKGK